jgi:hypothetical protein
VLIFKDATNSYVPRVIDFGYSTRSNDPNERISIPKSEFWTAPERGERDHDFNAAEAKKVDAYSFGLLCLWLLFYTGQEGDEFSFWSSLHSGYQALTLARQLLSKNSKFDGRQKQNLSELFELTLTRSPFDRSSDFGKFWNLLTPNE